MAFSESLKARVRQRSDMRCCLCHMIGVEIHHIIPQAENGEDSEENAAPLCPNCHETYGANPTKRKFLKEARDNWFEVCKNNLQRTSNLADELKDILVNFKSELLGDLKFLQSKENVLSLGEIISFLYEVDSKNEKIKNTEVDFLYNFYWGGNINPEFDELKNDLIERFGTETAKRCCKYVLLDLNIFLTVGFTENDINSTYYALFVLILALILNKEMDHNERFSFKTKKINDSQLVFALEDKTISL